MKLHTFIRRFGGSLYCHVPSSFVKSMEIENGQLVRIMETGKRSFEVRLVG